MNPLLLVIVHEASRSGSPRVVLELLRSLRRSTDLSISVRILVDGPLTEELRSMDRLGSDDRLSAVLVNSSVGVAALRDVPDDVPVAVYVHEDEEALSTLSRLERDVLVDRADQVLCVSDGVRRQLALIGVEPQRLSVLPPIVTHRSPPDSAGLAAVREGLGVAPDENLIVGCGEAVWHKGPDLFVEFARVLSMRRRVRFVWIGHRSRGIARMLEFDAAAVGISNRINWLGAVPDPFGYLAAADLVVSTSRRDAQPLVPLEAALAGTATVAFGVGGLAEFASLGVLSAVRYPDVEALATSAEQLLDLPSDAQRLVASCRAYISAQRVPEVVGPRFAERIRELVELGISRSARSRV